MDIETLLLAVNIAKKIMPEVTAADVGAIMTVGEDGTWAKGEVVTGTISVTNHTLTITAV